MWRMAMAGVFLVLIQAQEHPAIEVGEDRLLSADGPARPLSESQLSADPNNPKHLLAVVIQFDSPERNTCVAWASFDGGQRWTRRALPIQCFGDPWSVILSDGSAITVMLGHMDGHDDNAFLLRSPDGGRTWSEPPLGLGDHHDHPMVIAWRKEVYVVASQGVYESANQRRSSVFVLHSHDGGRTFGQPMRAIPSIPGFAAVGPTLLGNGTLAVGIHNHERQSVGGGALRPHSWLLRSQDQGLADKFDGVLVQRSDDRGESWSDPVRVNHSEKARSFTPSIAINKDGIIGVSWYEIHDKNCFDVYFTASLDAGKTFLPEVRVSSAASCPDTPQNKGVFNPGMTFGAGGDYSGLAATSDGLFHVVWSDSRSGIYQLRASTVTVRH